MTPWFFDTETCLIAPGRQAPPLVCLAETSEGESDLSHWTSPGLEIHLANVISAWPIVAHNVAFDLLVLAANFPGLLPLILDAYDADRVFCTDIRQRMLQTASGTYKGEVIHGAWRNYDYTLDSCSRRVLGRSLRKDTWRLSYGMFRDTPLDQWPERARELIAGGWTDIDGNKADETWGDPREYPLGDVHACEDLFQAQDKLFLQPYLLDQHRQARAYFAFALQSAYGLRTTPEGVAELERVTQAKYGELEAKLRSVGLVKKDGKRDLKAATAWMVKVCEEEGIPVKRNDPTSKALEKDPAALGSVQLGAEACEAVDDAIIQDYGTFGTLKTVISKDLKALKQGMYQPIHSRIGWAETGRTTSSGPNIQNWSTFGGVRECFQPRDGYVFVDNDVEAGELHAWAQVCKDLLGFSVLGDILNAGQDPHSRLAARIMGISYEEAIRRKKNAGPNDGQDAEFYYMRQTAKAGMFGLPGGMGPKTFCIAARGYGVDLTIEDRQGKIGAKTLKALWKEELPEADQYFDWVNRQLASGNRVQQLRSLRWRGGVTYCAACNTMFQGLLADGMKRAAWMLARECYDHRRGSILFGSRPVGFIHDEFLVEVLDDPAASDKCLRVAQIMKQGADEFMPDYPNSIEPTLTLVWSKQAKPLYTPSGALRVWHPVAA